MAENDRKAKRAARKAAKQGGGAGAEAGKKGGKGKDKKKKNPLMKEARRDYAAELRKQGVSEDQAKEKMRTHMKDIVKPAMTAAKAGAQSKNLKGAERKKFIEEALRSKLGIKAASGEGGRGK